MLNLIDQYIEARSGAWSVSTQRSERSRLRSMVTLMDGNPETLYKGLVKTNKPYSVKTAFIRVGEFYQFMINNNLVNETKNVYKAYLKERALLFKNAYVKEEVEVSYDEAVRRIEKIMDAGVRAKASQLIQTGMRYTESGTLENGSVVGKGGKRRRIYGHTDRVESGCSYSHFRNELKKVNLKPHTLRKLFATQLVERGAKEADLLAVMGWSSMQTAACYLQPKREAELELLVGKAVS